jgi:hypothetical protein
MTDKSFSPTSYLEKNLRLPLDGDVRSLPSKIAKLLRTDKSRLYTVLYRLDVDEIEIQKLYAEATRSEEVDRVASELAKLILLRLNAKMRTTAAHRARKAKQELL